MSSPIRLSLPLRYQKDIFHSLRNEDGLLVLARGLGLLHIVSNLLHSYDAAGNNLIILVNADDNENTWLGEALAEQALISNAAKCRGLQLCNTDSTGVGVREKLYASGGVLSVTSRILLVDLLSGILDPKGITGLVVLHADRISATDSEAFIVRLYRLGNKMGFLKAFSDRAEPLAGTQMALEKVLKNLFLRRTFLFPRFQVNVAEALEGKRKAEVIELEVQMTEAMREIQNAILECVEECIKELKKGNSELDVEDLNMDTALHRSFDLIVQRQLDRVWHRTSFRTRQLVADLKVLRDTLHYILAYDAVEFNQHLESVRAASAPTKGSSWHNPSPWLYLDAAQTVFATAKRRVYTGQLTEGSDWKPVLEELPKWKVLAEILDEIERDVYLNPHLQDQNGGAVLIMCGSYDTSRQLRQYLHSMYAEPGEDAEQDEADDEDKETGIRPNARHMMRRKLRQHLMWKQNFARVEKNLFVDNTKNTAQGSADQAGNRGERSRAPPNKRRRVRGNAAAAALGPHRTVGTTNSNLAGDKQAHIEALVRQLAPEEVESKPVDIAVGDSLEDVDKYYGLYDLKDVVIVHPYSGDMDDHLLEETKPRYVIMYEPDAAFIRRLEVYRSSHSNRQVRVYFMYYGGSVEEQRYLSVVRGEKDSFTKLIRERANMAMSFTHDTADLDPQDAFLRSVNTRIAGGGRLTATAEPPRVVFDVRESRSKVPSLLHARNMQPVPCTLTVGDYILTPDICVERKSLKDLVSSFANGRLYNQARSMLQHYTHPMLLIEFELHKAFTLEPFTDNAKSANALASQVGSDLQSKIVQLCLAFPRLRIIWSSSPYQTAEIFEELKKKQPEPNPVRAAEIGLEEGDDPSGRMFNQLPQDLLRAVPGVSAKALQRLILSFNDVQDVANADFDRLKAVVGRESARLIRNFFDQCNWDEDGNY
ncbi:DNA repair protein [Piedraia hortae CBS 480.64]|uniref:DNA repair protein n=1 Tax=Piedraia hortae CBS 480.64 TaxID=1314780 RepID=A0A6A7BY52_9PEZI|nr:DNA repair protein [Piedraia hortae CBS 480.64]